jgi:hypothetical protein
VWRVSPPHTAAILTRFGLPFNCGNASGRISGQARPTQMAIVKYYYAGGQREALRENGTLHWLMSDHLGSTAITADSGGEQEAELRYRAYGENRFVLR